MSSLVPAYTMLRGNACRRNAECGSKRSGSNSVKQRKESEGASVPRARRTYLIGEKLVIFAEEAERQPEFAKELPRFLAAMWQVFNQYELAGYAASQKRAMRSQLRKLLYMN